MSVFFIFRYSTWFYFLYCLLLGFYVLMLFIYAASFHGTPKKIKFFLMVLIIHILRHIFPCLSNSHRWGVRWNFSKQIFLYFFFFFTFSFKDTCLLYCLNNCCWMRWYYNFNCKITKQILIFNLLNCHCCFLYISSINYLFILV